ncbi:hypothetical protein Daus18300_010424 [Diaporthe australafricana]|uniref:Uncharacterized protein n=1 Tax=Diaporthe australafricana TaxID=127596 RepID=A0ABR3WB14_9PEZI
MHFQYFALSLLLAFAGAAPTKGSGHTTPTKPGSTTPNKPGDTTPTQSGVTTSTKPEPVPEYMTVATCKAMMDPTKAKKALFWSGCGNKAKNALTNKKDYPYLAGYEVMRGIFKQPWPKDYNTFKDGFKTKDQDTQITADHSFWDACSQALAGLAAAAGGDAYIMMPGTDASKGIDWGDRATSHWAQHEYPIICKGTAVTKLYRLSATDAKVKEDITDLMVAQRTAGKCPPLSKVTGGGEDD